MAESRKYYWQKLKNDFFSDKRIKKLRRMNPDYVVIYLEMELKSLQNNGTFEYLGLEDTFYEELALDLDEDEEDVKVVVDFLLAHGLMVQDENIYSLAQVDVGCETASAEKMRNHRAKKDEESHCDNNVTQIDNNVTTMCAQSDGDIEIEKEIEKELENNTLSSKNDEVSEQIQEVFDSYNQICPSLQKATKLSAQRKAKIKTRLKVYSIDDFKKAFRKAESSDFLVGNSNTGFKANLDWLIENDNNLLKVLEGNYDNKPIQTKSPPKSQPKKVNFEERERPNDADLDDLERRLLGRSG